ncbi:TolC family protein [Arcobacter sp. LA11]|uniref:TolC family protein n=1 Tax=Arcobacter sp. LA11 TaxID=1898176 RepID=UPI000932B666|nr:TolC family protein [Arcobacter sp. LA11]
MNKNILKVIPVFFIGLNLYALDINEAVEISLLNNNNLKKQQYIYDEAKENINISKSSYQPKLDLSYTYNANAEDINSSGKDNSNASAVLSYNLFNGLTDKYNLKSSEQLADTSMYNYQAAKYDLIYSVKQYYITYLKSLKNIETQNNAFKLLEQQYKDSENRFAQGLLARNDLLQVNAQMLQSKQDLARAKADSKIARYQLKNVLGGSLDSNEKINDLQKEKIMLENYNLEELDSRSEIKAVKMTIESLVSQKSANKGNYMPSADLSLTYTKYGDDAFLDVDDSNVDDQQTATINLKWNLFNGGKDSSQDIIYQKRLLQTKEALEDLKLSIKLQYEEAIEEFEVSQLNFETAKVSLEQSNENYKIVNNRFKEGLSSSTDLINANFLLSSAKQSFDNAYYDRFLAKASLDRIFEK